MNKSCGVKVLLILTIFVMSNVYAQTSVSLINEIEVSPNGLHTAVAYSSGRTILIDNVTQNEILLRSGGESTSAIMIFAWSPDGTQIASGDDRGIVEIWDVTTQQIVTSFAGRYSAVTGLNWTSDGNRLLAGYSEEAAALWEVATGHILTEITVGQTHSADLNPDDASFVVGSIGHISIWDTITGQNILDIETGYFEGHTVWNSTGNRFFSWSVGVVDNYLSLDIRDGTTGAVIRSMDIPGNVPVGGILEAGWSPDDRLIYTGSILGYINVWDAETGAFVDSIEYDGQIGGLDILPDGSQFVFGGVPNNGQPATVQYAPAPDLPILPSKHGTY